MLFSLGRSGMPFDYLSLKSHQQCVKRSFYGFFHDKLIENNTGYGTDFHIISKPSSQGTLGTKSLSEKNINKIVSYCLFFRGIFF